ncbi:MAG: hypothetical protein OXU62_03470 [Gammaproteobacteria bacterium]|nr:hypothetical protein [Gammaproteobacteria bacterium]
MFEYLLRAVYHSAGAPGIYPLPAPIHRHAHNLLSGRQESLLSTTVDGFCLLLRDDL